MLLLTKGSFIQKVCVEATGEFALRPKVAILISNCKDMFRMIFSMTVSNFVKVSGINDFSLT